MANVFRHGKPPFEEKGAISGAFDVAEYPC